MKHRNGFGLKALCCLALVASLSSAAARAATLESPKLKKFLKSIGVYRCRGLSHGSL